MIEALEPRRLLSDEMRIDAGNNANYVDSSSHLWQADTDYAGGEVKTWAFAPKETSDPGLLTTRREGTSFRYLVPLDNGQYTVTILEAEPFFKQAGQRVFDVYADGQKVITGWDLVASAGYATATQKSFQVTVENPNLPTVLRFVGEKDEAIVAAIDIVPTITPQPRPAHPYNVAASWDKQGQIIVNWEDPDSDKATDTGYRVERSTDGSKYHTVFLAPGGDPNAFLDTDVHRGHHYIYRIRAFNITATSLPAVAKVATTKPWVPTPFSGKPAVVPGTVLCENFDYGGNGISYFDTDISDDGPDDGPLVSGDYRGSPVDLNPMGSIPGEFELTDVVQGEWLDYTISIPKAEQFSIATQYGNSGNGSEIHYDLDGKGITPEIALAATGDFEDYATVASVTTALPKGVHVLRLCMDVQSDDGNVGNFVSIKFTAVSAATTSSIKLAKSVPTSATTARSLFSAAPIDEKNQIEGILSGSDAAGLL